MAKYEVVAVNRVTGQEARHVFIGAPGDGVIAQWLYNLCLRGATLPREARDVGAFLATRYFPSRKAWVILDFKHAQPQQLRTRAGVVVWCNVQRDRKLYPSRAAALMKISYMIAAPEQLALI